MALKLQKRNTNLIPRIKLLPSLKNEEKIIYKNHGIKNESDL